MTATRTERQNARTDTRLPVDARSPVGMRDFPQFHHPGPDAYTMAEYEQIRAAWVEHGSPKVGTATEALTI